MDGLDNLPESRLKNHANRRYDGRAAGHRGPSALSERLGVARKGTRLSDAQTWDIGGFTRHARDGRDLNMTNVGFRPNSRETRQHSFQDEDS